MQDEIQLLILCRGLSPFSRTVRQCHLDEFRLYPFIGRNIITAPVKKGSRQYERFAAELKSYNNDSSTYFNDSVDNSILYDEGNACGSIAIPSIEITFDNDHIHV